MISRRGKFWIGWWQNRYIPPPEIAQLIINDGFTTVIDFRATGFYQTLEVTGFSTEFTGYGGSIVNVSSFNTVVDFQATAGTYGVLEIDSFNTSFDFQIDNGTLTSILINSFNTEFTGHGGSVLEFPLFNTFFDFQVTANAIANLNLTRFTTVIDFTSSIEPTAELIIRPPIMTGGWSELNIGNFVTMFDFRDDINLANIAAYSITISSSETTQYSNYNFDTVVKLNGEYYGIKSDGVYLLRGSKDINNDIDGEFKTSVMDFGSALHKRMPYVYIDSDNETDITSYVDDNFIGVYTSSFTGRRTKLARGARGRFWSFKVNNKNGNKFKIGSLEMYPSIQRRKV